MPSVGEKRWVNISQWHSTLVGANMWILFRPPLSQAQGWGFYPHEMEKSAVVECEVTDYADFLPLAILGEPSLDTDSSLYCRVRTFRLGLTFTPQNRREFPHLFELRGWMQVRVVRVIPLLQISSYFPEGEPVGPFTMWDNGWSCESQNLLLEAGSDGEIFEWRVRNQGANSRVIIYAFESGRDAAEICNCIFQE